MFHHKQPKQPRLVCAVCEYKTASPKDMARHLHQIHPEKLEEPTQ